MCRPPASTNNSALILGPNYPTTVFCDQYQYTGFRKSVSSNYLSALAIIATRKSDGKLQLLMSNNSNVNTNIGYYIVYNGNDPAATSFATESAVNDYLNTPYIADPPSKQYADHSKEDVSAVYSSLKLATFYSTT